MEEVCTRCRIQTNYNVISYTQCLKYIMLLICTVRPKHDACLILQNKATNGHAGLVKILVKQTSDKTLFQKAFRDIPLGKLAGLSV